jgi:hypothetical protein
MKRSWPADDATFATSLIIANRVVVLHARSGVGKTSLVHAGIIPRLRAEGIEPLATRVAADVAHPFSFSIDDERFRRSTHPSSLAEAIRTTQQAAPEERTNFLLILEQCEEMFIRSEPRCRGWDRLATISFEASTTH